MNHEIVGPEMTATTGQSRLQKSEAIAQHIAQYSTPSMFRVEEPKDKPESNDVKNLKAEQEKQRLDIEHDLIVHFLLAGNSEMALDTALHTGQLRSGHPELFSAMEKLTSFRLASDDRLWDGFHAVLKQIKPR